MDSLSVISNNCMGGCMLYDLHVKYQSPTVSLQILPEEYCKFCNHIKHYMDVELIECPIEHLSEEHKRYLMKMFDKIPDMPYGLVDDVLVCFQHYPTFKDGADMWNRRKARFDPEHIAYIFYVRSDIYMNELMEFVNLRLDNSIIFTENFDVNVSMDHCRINPPEGGHFLDIMPDGTRHYEKFWDPVKWMFKIERSLYGQSE